MNIYEDMEFSFGRASQYCHPVNKTKWGEVSYILSIHRGSDMHVYDLEVMRRNTMLCLVAGRGRLFELSSDYSAPVGADATRPVPSASFLCPASAFLPLQPIPALSDLSMSVSLTFIALSNPASRISVLPAADAVHYSIHSLRQRRF